MSLNDIPLFAMLKGELTYQTQRQNLLARNVANADTPDYAPVDLKPFSVEKAIEGAKASGNLRLAITNQNQIQAVSASAKPWTDQNAPDSEVRLDGNHVVLEEQMIKVSQAQGDFSAAVGLYQKSMQLLQTAIKKPGS